jgi:hypothetical protein
VGSGGSSLGALFTPLSTQLSLYFGTMICMQVFFSLLLSYIYLSTKLLHRIAYCACFATNTWNAQNFPFLSQNLFFENGTIYDQLAILDSNFRLDPAKLAEAVCYFFILFFILGDTFIDKSRRDCHGSLALQFLPTLAIICLLVLR